MLIYVKDEIKTAIVLVGGAGFRLYPLTEDKPKCMIEVANKPILYWVLNWLKSYGIENVVLGVAYKKEIVINYIKSNDFGLNIKFSEHSVDGETGEGFRLAIERYIKDENFIAMNGDELTNVNLAKAIQFHQENKPMATIIISPLRLPFGIVELWGDNIVGFKEKPFITDKFVSTGVYIFNKKIKEYLPGKGPIEKATFPRLAELNALKAFQISSNERWLTINTLKDLLRAEEELKFMGFLERFSGD